MRPRVLSLGDSAFTIEFAPDFDAAARRAVVRLDAALAAKRGEEALAGVVDVVPTFRSLTVHYDPLVTSRAELEPSVTGLVDSAEDTRVPTGALWRLPTLYGGDGGPDLASLAEACGLTTTEVIDLHAQTEVEVYMLGFLPGFAFMGDIAAKLRQPRRSEPRLRVPAGAVAVADRLTAIYPWESPGGWHLIGTCPVPLFDPAREPPALLAPADRMAFEPVAADRLREIAAALQAGDCAPESFRQEP